MGEVRDRFPQLVRYWNTGCGLRLQNIDSDICTRVQRRLRESGRPCLSVHDSFIVMAADADWLRTVMGEELEITCAQLRKLSGKCF